MTTYDELLLMGPTEAQLAFEEAINEIYGIEGAADLLADES